MASATGAKLIYQIDIIRLDISFGLDVFEKISKSTESGMDAMEDADADLGVFRLGDRRLGDASILTSMQEFFRTFVSFRERKCFYDCYAERAK